LQLVKQQWTQGVWERRMMQEKQQGYDSSSERKLCSQILVFYRSPPERNFSTGNARGSV
jgi:hypothetical protein